MRIKLTYGLDEERPGCHLQRTHTSCAVLKAGIGLRRSRGRLQGPLRLPGCESASMSKSHPHRCSHTKVKSGHCSLLL